MSGVGTVTGATAAGLVRLVETDTGTSATLLQKALQSDKDLVATLLPTPSSGASFSSGNGGLNIRA